MLKLIKYEFQKQIFSKMVIELTFGIFYVAIESIIVFEKDLSTKQSYMLFLVPKTSKEILGSKIIANVLQIIVTLVSFIAVIGLCGSILVIKSEGVQAFISGMKEFIERVFQIDLNLAYLVAGVVTLVVLWLFLVMLGILITTALHTILGGNKFISFLAIVSYFVLIYVVGCGENMIYGHGLSEMVEDIICYVYYGILDLLFFFATSWLMDKKLSV